MNEFESLLLELLNFVKSRSQDAAYFKQCFIDIVIGVKYVPFEAVEFCMRELQWPEVRDVALRRLIDSPDFRVKDIMNRIIEVYDQVWQNRDLYAYYSQDDQ